ncbi:MAG: Unknown protein, partial [uncultured Sulfurovum sp.]
VAKGLATAVTTGALAGAASGAILTRSFSGAMKGALFGALSAGVLQGVSNATSSLFKVDIKHSIGKLMRAGMHKAAAFKSIANGLSRGLISKLQGGSFKRSFLMSTGSSALRALYMKVVGYESTLQRGEEYEKKDWNKYVTNYKIGNTPFLPNTIGRNELLGGENWYSFENIGRQGGLVSRLTNLIPGFNSFSKFHDELVKGGGVTEAYNFGSMVPSLAVNYASIYNQNIDVIHMTENNRRRR